MTVFGYSAALQHSMNAVIKPFHNQFIFAADTVTIENSKSFQDSSTCNSHFMCKDESQSWQWVFRLRSLSRHAENVLISKLFNH